MNAVLSRVSMVVCVLTMQMVFIVIVWMAILARTVRLLHPCVPLCLVLMEHHVSLNLPITRAFVFWVMWGSPAKPISTSVVPPLVFKAPVLMASICSLVRVPHRMVARCARSTASNRVGVPQLNNQLLMRPRRIILLCLRTPILSFLHALLPEVSS